MTTYTSAQGALFPLKYFPRVCEEPMEWNDVRDFKKGKSKVILPCEYKDRDCLVWKWTARGAASYAKAKFAMDFLRKRPQHPSFLPFWFGFLTRQNDEQVEAIFVTKFAEQMTDEELKRDNEVSRENEVRRDEKVRLGICWVVQWLRLSRVNSDLHKEFLFKRMRGGEFVEPKVFVMPTMDVDQRILEDNADFLKEIFPDGRMSDDITRLSQSLDVHDSPDWSHFELKLAMFHYLHSQISVKRQKALEALACPYYDEIVDLQNESKRLQGWQAVMNPGKVPAMIKFLMEKESVVGQHLVERKLSSNDPWCILGTQSGDTLCFDRGGAKLTVELTQPITAIGFIIKTTELRDMMLRNVRLTVMARKKNEMELYNNDICTFSAKEQPKPLALAKTELRIMIEKGRWTPGKVFTLYRWSDSDLDSPRFIRGFDIITADHPYGYFNDMIVSQGGLSPHVSKVTTSTSNETTVATFGNQVGAQEWMEVAFPRHIAHVDSFIAEFSESCEASKADWRLDVCLGNGEWHVVKIGSFSDPPQHDINKFIDVVGNRFRLVILNGGSRLLLKRFELGGDLHYNASNIH